MIYDIIEKIKNEPSSNGKLEILEANKHNKLLKLVLLYTYNPLFNYYTKHQVQEYRQYETVQNDHEMDLQFIFPLLDCIIERKTTGNNAKINLEDLANELHYLDRIVLNKIISRDLDCGIGVKSINKVFPGLIPTVPYMRCSLTDKIDRIKYPAIVQQKCDGMFVNVVYKDGIVKFFTRNGTEFDLNCLKQELLHTFQQHPKDWNVVLHGEMLVAGDEGSVESRKIGNGLINSLIKKDQVIDSLQEKMKSAIKGKAQTKISSEITKKLAEYDDTDNRLRLIIWDVVTYDSWVAGESDVQYTSRFDSLKQFTSENVLIVENREVGCYIEAQDFYREQISAGFEGAVLKNWGMTWKNHTSPEQIKLKAERETELKIVGCVEGTGKYEGGLGAVVCQSSCGKLLVNVGSGFSDSERGFERVDENDSSKGLKLLEDFNPNSYIGKIISVKFNEVIESESKDTYSLFLPRFMEVREDKNEADSLDKIKKI